MTDSELLIRSSHTILEHFAVTFEAEFSDEARINIGS